MSAWDEQYKKNLAAYDKQMKAQLDDNDTMHKEKSDSIKSIYEDSITEEEQGYDDLSRQNEVQKYINAREVAENNANLGLTDSGLNRTQQTAVQLSASNQEAKIQRARQSAVAALTREMNSKLADIETSRLSSAASIRSGYEQMASDAATETIKAQISAENERIKAQQEATKAQNSEYTKLLSAAADADLTNKELNLATIYNWADTYDPETDSTYYTNSDISALLAIYGLTKEEWKDYVEKRKGYTEKEYDPIGPSTVYPLKTKRTRVIQNPDGTTRTVILPKGYDPNAPVTTWLEDWKKSVGK